MKKIFFLSFFFITTLSFSRLSESYIARISSNDQFNSKGKRLRNAAEIIRQDRANFHDYGLIDDEDQGDIFFSHFESRQILEEMLKKGKITSKASYLIVNENPIIKVDIYSDGFINVSVYEDFPSANIDIKRPKN